MMPGMNGFVVCDIVKNELGMKDVFVLMLTASVRGVNKQNYYKDVGADLFMTKPFDPDRIINEVAKLLKIEI
jgi:CheY-like chemotaxis protein